MEAWGSDWDGYESDLTDDELHHGRYGKDDRRGNSKDRRVRKLWMLATFDVDLGPDKCRCFLCEKPLSYKTVTADRIIPGAFGGTYRRENLRPACMSCNIAQRDRMFKMSCPLPREVTS